MKIENALKAIEIIDEAITKLTALRDAEKAKIKAKSKESTGENILTQLINAIKAENEAEAEEEISLEELKKFPHIQSAMKEATFKLLPDKYKEDALRGYHNFFMSFRFSAN